MAYDLTAKQTELDALRALKLKLIRAGGVLETKIGNRTVKRWTLTEIDQAIDQLERDLTSTGGGFHLAEPFSG